MNPSLSPEGIAVLVILAVIVTLLATTKASIDLVMMLGLAALILAPVPGQDGWQMGILSNDEALRGFSNSSLATVAVLYVVVAGLKSTGAIDLLIKFLFIGHPKTVSGALVKICVPVAALSTFLNNTPVVAMLIPAVTDWARKYNISPSKLLIPLSYAAILGGTCSMIGTSTNLVVSGLASNKLGMSPFSIFSITPVGICVTLLVGAIMIVIAPIILPDRRSASDVLFNPLEYTTEMKIPEGSPLHEQTVLESGLSTTGCYLIEIERNGEIIPAVGPRHRLKANDRLVFTGGVDAVHKLSQFRGLAPVTDQIFKLRSPRHRRLTFETVLAPDSSLIDQTVKESAFRSKFGGVVLAVARNSTRVPGAIGDIVLKAGDVLLVEALAVFEVTAQSSPEFLMVKALKDSTPKRVDRAPLALAILLAMVLIAAFNILDMFAAGLLAAILMVATNCCNTQEARKSIGWSVLIVIGAALGIGAALDKSGVGSFIASYLLKFAHGNPWYTLIAIYVTTSIITEFITNNAAVALIFPVAIASAEQLGVRPEPFLYALMFAGSASFATPLGYQTNLMVYGPGGYTFADFLKIGLIMDIVAGTTTVILVPYFFPF